MELKVFINFFIAIAIGTLIGIERQRGQKTGGFAGIRTFIMIAFMGALTAFLYQELDYTLILPLTFASLFILITASYIISAYRGYFGITSELSAIICFFLGFIIMFEKYQNYGLSFGVLMTILLSMKDTLHRFIENAKDFEWRDTLKFALIAFVILPLLPKEIYIPIFHNPNLTDANYFYPREIWLLVVFVSAVSFIGYFLIKTVGGKRGLNLIAAFGGIVSSTAVTQSMASYSKSKIKDVFVNYKPLSNAVILATCFSFVKVAIIALSIDKNLSSILFPIALLIIIGLFIVIISSKDEDSVDTKIRIESPLKLKPAFVLAFLYALLTFLSKISFHAGLGKAGFIVASVVAGIFDIDPVILTASTLSSSGSLTISEAVIIILLALSAAQITKSFIAISTGAKKFGRSVAIKLLFFVCILLIWTFFFKNF